MIYIYYSIIIRGMYVAASQAECNIKKKNMAQALLICFKNREKLTTWVINSIRSDKMVSFNYMLEKAITINDWILKERWKTKDNTMLKEEVGIYIYIYI
jgi:hypothetical protein